MRTFSKHFSINDHSQKRITREEKMDARARIVLPMFSGLRP
jgi:hypothetical protein